MKKIPILKLLLLAYIITCSIGCENQIYDEQNVQVKSSSTGPTPIKRTYKGAANSLTYYFFELYSASTTSYPDFVIVKIFSINEELLDSFVYVSNTIIPPPPPCQCDQLNINCHLTGTYCRILADNGTMLFDGMTRRSLPNMQIRATLISNR